ncbi:MAG: hypothetical protein AAGJ18_21010 [Bacteroidota bacterium]
MSDLLVEKDFYTEEFKERFSKESVITFKYSENKDNVPYEKREYDWYIVVALKKADKVKEDRHLLTRDLILSYRWAIREGFNHQLDKNLQNRYDYPRNRNTIKGIKGYVALIKKRDEAVKRANGLLD